VNLKVAKEGVDDWLPGPGAEDKFTGKSGEVTFETEGKRSITCTSAALEGEYTGPRTDATKLTLSGCRYLATNQPCQTSPTAQGTIEGSGSLEGELGFLTIPSSPLVPTVGWDLKGLSMTFTCEKLPEPSITIGTIEGSVIASLTPADAMSRTMTLTYSASSGKQLPEMFEGAEADTLTMKLRTGLEESAEPSGVTMSVAIKNGEPLEVKAQTCETYVGCEP
jgi:hypothetical protein